jgi:hypothetical protein
MTLASCISDSKSTTVWLIGRYRFVITEPVTFPEMICIGFSGPADTKTDAKRLKKDMTG